MSRDPKTKRRNYGIIFFGSGVGILLAAHHLNFFWWAVLFFSVLMGFGVILLVKELDE